MLVISIDKLYGELIAQKLKASTPVIEAIPVVPNVRQLPKLLDEYGVKTLLIDLQTVATLRNWLATVPSSVRRVLLVPEAKPEHVDIARGINATAIIQTSMDADLLNYALDLAIRGGSFFPSTLWDKSLLRTKYGRDDKEVIHGVEVTRKERGILDGLGRGNTNKVIADDLGLSEGTVKVYLSKLCKKFKVTNRTQLLLKVMGEQAVG